MSQTVSGQSSAIPQRWKPGFETLANEERVITYKFFDATNGMTPGINGQFNMRKIAAAATQTLATTYQGSTGLTYNTLATTSVPITPVFDYSAIEVSLDLKSQLDDDAAYEAACKKQAVASLATTLDVAGGAQALSLSTVKGSGGVNLDKSLLYDAWNSLIVNAKDQFKVGQTKAHLVLYNRQCKYLINISEFVSANLRGDGTSPITRGWVSDTMNMTIEESGNISTTGGAAHNMLFLPMCQAIGFNLKPQVLETQQFELVFRIICVQARGIAEYFDEYGVDMQTGTA